MGHNRVPNKILVIAAVQSAACEHVFSSRCSPTMLVSTHRLTTWRTAQHKFVMWWYPLSPFNGWKVSRVFLRNITHSPGALSVSSSMLLRQKSCRKKINASLANEKHCWDYSSYSLKSKSSLKPPMTIWQVVCRWKKKQAKLSSYFICMSCAHSSSHLQKKGICYTLLIFPNKKLFRRDT